MTTRVLNALCLVCATLSFGMARWAGDLEVENGKETEQMGTTQRVGGGHGGVSVRGPNVAGEVDKQPGECAVKVEDLLSRIAKLERAGKPLPESRLAVFEAIAGMSKEQLRLFVEDAADSPDIFRLFRYDVRFAARRLGELDPKVVAALCEKRGRNDLLASSMLAPWAHRDPQAFATWVTSLPALKQSTAGRAVVALARDHPEQFADLAPLLRDSPAGPPGAEAVIQKMFGPAGAKGDPSNALAYANALPEGAIRDRALASLANWRGLDLAQHPEVMAAVGNLPPEVARKMGGDLSAIASKLPEGPARESAFSKALKDATDKDPVAATKRLDELAGSKDYPAAVLGMVGATVGKDPGTAADWALSIGAQSAAVRQHALEGVAQAWFQKDPDAARAWVEKAQLTDREYFILTGRVRGQ